MNPYAPILILILFVIGMVVVIMALTHLIGPSWHGAGEGFARRRFNVKFYIVAMFFLLFGTNPLRRTARCDIAASGQAGS